MCKAKYGKKVVKALISIPMHIYIGFFFFLKKPYDISGGFRIWQIIGLRTLGGGARRVLPPGPCIFLC